MEIIPAIDLLDGKAVRLRKGRYEEVTVYSDNPPAIGRNVFRGPRYFNVDMTVSKRFGLPNLGALGENPNLDLRFNFFNLFNITNIAPFQNFSNSTRTDRINFGEATALLAGRVIEMQLRFSF